MATVRSLTMKTLSAPRPQEDVAATVSIVEAQGEAFIQINTYGSADRLVKGVPSQTLRLTRSVIEELARLAAKLPT